MSHESLDNPLDSFESELRRSQETFRQHVERLVDGAEFEDLGDLITTELNCYYRTADGGIVHVMFQVDVRPPMSAVVEDLGTEIFNTDVSDLEHVVVIYPEGRIPSMKDDDSVRVAVSDFEGNFHDDHSGVAEDATEINALLATLTSDNLISLVKMN